MCLWDSKSLIIRENYSLSETVLNILCQILVGDSQLQKKLAEQQQAQPPATVSTNQNMASSLRASIQNVSDARDQFLAAMHDVSSSLPQSTDASNSNTNPPAAVSNSATPAVQSAPSTRQLTPEDQEIISQMIARVSHQS